MTHHRPPRFRSSLPADAIAERAIVAIVGRPNVGKSTLFNRLVGARLAIVHDEPGVTRDRHYADVFSCGVSYILVDTGGFDLESEDSMRQGIARQVRVAIDQADVIVCVVDGTEAPAPADHEAVQLLRESEKPVVFVANKADGPRVAESAVDYYRLGIDKVLMVSALHGLGFPDLEEAIVNELDRLGKTTASEATADESWGAYPRVALVGRPNAGKSSLLNRLVGEERSLVHEEAGTTRDTIDALVTTKRRHADGTLTDEKLVVMDTAGIRKKARVTDPVEAISVLSAIRAIERSEIIVLLCDASEGVAEQDAKILGLAIERGKPVIIALNKCDILDKSEQTRAMEVLKDKLHFVLWAKTEMISAKTGRGVASVIDTVCAVRDNWCKRVTTGELNRFFAEAIETHPPPTMSGRSVRLYYITQAETRPPTFIVVSNWHEHIHFSYQRYVQNRIREHFAFDGTPLRVRYRAKSRKNDPA
jgi:GTP-binding protein